MLLIVMYMIVESDGSINCYHCDYELTDMLDVDAESLCRWHDEEKYRDCPIIMLNTTHIGTYTNTHTRVGVECSLFSSFELI